ncbi:MAG: aminodeoxychorismate synthase component I, partial [Candidatus Thiodiazotropha taylori]
MSIEVIAFPYRRDSAELFEAIAHLPWAAFLDSCHPYTDQGRYDILSADPQSVLITRGEQTRIVASGGSMRLSTQDPFQLLNES